MVLSASTKPLAFSFGQLKTALLLVHSRYDSVDYGGSGEVPASDLAAIEVSVRPAVAILQRAREAGLTIVHTRGGYGTSSKASPTGNQANTSDYRQGGVIGDVEPVPIHNLVEPLGPVPGEVVIDKAGLGAFYGTELHQILINRAVSHLIIVGMAKDSGSIMTLREANDRVVDDATGRDPPVFNHSSSSMLASSDARPLEKYASEALGPTAWDGSLDIQTLRHLYANAIITPEEVVNEVYRRLKLPTADPAVWLHVFPQGDAVQRARQLSKAYPDPATRHPLWGIPISIKDIIDIAGVPTTVACPEFAYIPEKDALLYSTLIEAGCIVIGKVNLDQLATGLVGMRSPYGQPGSAFSREYISGGSSSGSCVSVASNQVSFSIGTDTAGSGRVPAAFNNIIGFKPTRGTIPMTGVVPASKSLDTIAIEALTVADARVVWNTLFKIDGLDPFSKVSRPPWVLSPRAILRPGEEFKFSIAPADSESREVVSTEFNDLFEQAVLLMKTIGGQLVNDIDYPIFEKAGTLLYRGSLISERISGIRPWYDAHPAPVEPGGKDALLPETRAVYTMAENYSAADVWSDLYSMMTLQRLAQIEFEKMNVLVVPTVPIHPTKVQYLADPAGVNYNLGKFAHFANILDLTGVSCPAGFTRDGMPFVITILGPSFSDGMVLEIPERFEAAFGQPAGINGRPSNNNVH
ncbi:hypothetical protein BS47DRAFT_1390275 [Hydnum rufescens UP504]|uniref:Amidase n=1 Tax=Hydnum rufescens UP504 TaxID=1448309 RepID=A0A9P6DZP8_9AGAM|nr:hypothetical protein BS47DRAFT_1390275 [Hydnum rufescens UP504]